MTVTGGMVAGGGVVVAGGVVVVEHVKFPAVFIHV